MGANMFVKYSSFVVDVDDETSTSTVPSAAFILSQTRHLESESVNFLWKDEQMRCQTKQDMRGNNMLVSRLKFSVDGGLSAVFS